MRVEVLICEPAQSSPGGGDAPDRLQPPHPRRRANRAVKVTQERQDIILKRASAAQDCLVQGCRAS